MTGRTNKSGRRIALDEAAMRGAAVSLALLGAVACAPLAFAAEAPAGSSSRIVQPLTDGWRFRQDDSLTGAERPDFADSDWSQVSVPHSWNRAGYYLTTDIAHINTKDTINLHQGVGWYRLSFTAPAPAKGRKAWLQFDAASRTAEVWLNGVRLGVHKGGFSRFRFDATAPLKPGQANELAVRVNNTVPAPGNETADTLPLAGDFFVHGGLYRPVSLITTSDTHFDMLDFGGPGLYATAAHVTDPTAELTVRARLSNDSAKPLKGVLAIRLVDAQGHVAASQTAPVTLAPGAATEVSPTLAVAAPHLWQGVDDPYLYRIVAELQTAKGVVLDQITQNFGFRDIRIDPDKGFFLNGRHLALHGVSRHQDREGKGWAVSAEDETDDFRLIRDMGANTVRLAHYQQSEHINDLADQSGLILWDEIPLVSKWTLGPGAMTASPGLVANARQQLTELIRQNRNHAAVAVWSIANEVDFGSPVGVDFSRADGDAPDPRPLLRELNALAKAEDPSRPTTLATCCEGRSELPGAKPPVVADITDVFGANRYFGWYYGPATAQGPYIDKNHAEHPDRALSVSEYGAGGALSQQTDNPLGAQASSRGRVQPEGYESYVHEAIWADFAKRPYIWAAWVWNMFDFATTIRREGDSMDVNTKGLVTYDRKTLKDAYFFYKVNWSKDPVVYITGRRYVDRAYAVTDVKVYSNAAATELSLNGRSLGAKADCPNHVCVWSDVPLTAGDNTVAAKAAFGAQSVSDQVSWKLDAARADHIWIDAGSVMGRTTAKGRYGSDNFFIGGSFAELNTKSFLVAKPVDRTVAGASDQDLVGSYRHGTFAYDAPAANGDYAVTLTFMEPDGLAPGARVFDVAANGKPALKAFDVATAAGGPLKAVEKTFNVRVSEGRVRLDFKPIKGEALVSAIEITRVSAPARK